MNRALLSILLGLGLTTAAFAGGTITWPSPPLPPDANRAAIGAAPIQGWLNRFSQNVTDARRMDHIDILFDGDTLAITNGQYGPQGGMWQQFAKYKAVDFSSPGDATQTILWRLENGQIDGLHPKLVVLTVGGSNIGNATPEQVAEAVKAIIGEYQKRCPDATILLQGIMPHAEKPTDPIRAKITAANQLISAFADGKKVIYLDFGAKLLQPDGTLSRDVMADFSRPGPKGYPIWAEAIQPIVTQVLLQAAVPSTASTTNSTPVAACGGTITWPQPPSPAGANPAAIPTPPMGWMPRLQKNIDDSRKMKSVDLIFDGDSITDAWRGGAGGLWNKYYARLNAFDFGISGNTTQDIIWRLQNGQVDGLHPKLVVMLIGTNNMYSSSAEQIAGGIKADVDEYRKRLPDTAVLLLGIFPRGQMATDPLRAKVKAVNQIISKYADGKNVFYIDFGDKLLTPDGTYGPPMTHDFLHPGLPGYQIWVDSIHPIIVQFFPQAAADAAPAPAPASNAPAAAPSSNAPATTAATNMP